MKSRRQTGISCVLLSNGEWVCTPVRRYGACQQKPKKTRGTHLKTDALHTDWTRMVRVQTKQCTQPVAPPLSRMRTFTPVAFRFKFTLTVSAKALDNVAAPAIVGDKFDRFEPPNVRLVPEHVPHGRRSLVDLKRVPGQPDPL